MSDYTIMVYDLMRNNFDFGLTEYPIFNEVYRIELNNRILNFYKFYEIAFDNPNMFKDRLQQRMEMIMASKYNAMYKALEIEFDPLNNVKMTETFSREVSNNSSGSSKESSTSISDGDNTQINFMYPNENMTKNDFTNAIYANNGAHASNNNVNENSNTSIGTQETSGIEKYTRTNEGSSAGLPFSKAMLQYYDFLNKSQIDKQIIADLGDLFLSKVEI